MARAAGHRDYHAAVRPARGIGADGVLWGPAGRDPFGIRLFNPDGGEFEKSGNGLRIFAALSWDEGLPRDGITTS